MWRRVPEVLGNGLASFILEISNGFVMLLFNRQLLAYVGEMGITVYGIITNTALVASSISNGIAQAVQPLLSANFGAGNLKRVGEARKLGVRTGFAAGFIFTAIGMLIPVQLSYLFLDPTPEILTMAVPAIRLYFLCFLVSEWNIISGTYFQSTVRPRFSLTITLLRGVILNSVFVFLLPALFGVDGIWLTVTVSEFITAGVASVLMKRENINIKKYGNCSVGLRTCCADRKKTIGWRAKIPSAKLIWNGFLRVTMKVLNSYKICKQRTQGSLRKRISDSVVSFIAAFPEEASGGRFCRCIWKKQEINSLNLFQLTL